MARILDRECEPRPDKTEDGDNQAMINIDKRCSTIDGSYVDLIKLISKQ